MKTANHLIFIAFILFAQLSVASTESDTVAKEENIAALDCYTLDDQISSLIPLTYSTRPGFYEDPDNITIGSIGFYHYANALAFWVYKESEKRGEQVKIDRNIIHVAELQKLKAQKRCFEK